MIRTKVCDQILYFRPAEAPHSTLAVGKALIAISKETNPPLRLPLGADARYVIQGKIDSIQKELDEWKELEVSVVADDADPHFFEKLNGTVM